MRTHNWFLLFKSTNAVGIDGILCLYTSNLKSVVYLLICLSTLTFSSCQKDDNNGLQAENGEELSGGEGTVFVTGENAFALSMPGLTSMQQLEFATGNSFFNQNWVSAPASTTARDGLGPLFNARSCSGCHFKDGRGRAPISFGEHSTGFLIRLSVPGTDATGGPLSHPDFGGQLQDISIQNVTAEGEAIVTYTEIAGTYADGTPYSLRQPAYDIDFNDGISTTSGMMLSPRVANQMVGLGLLEALDEGTILAFADEFDSNGDGISGRPNYVWDVETQTTKLGRFGWKANQPNLKQQTAGAFVGDMGLTTTLFPNDECTSSQSDCLSAPNGGSPEVTDENLRKVVLYASSLAVPARRNWTDKTVLQGKQLFMYIGCASCHIPKMTTGTHPVFDALSNQTIRPYTDMLLHDMGEGLADGRPDYLATGSEWRTPPLWGIGLFQTVNHHTNYLHDGRARNLEEAILWHGGEAENAQSAFKQLTQTERNAIILFLNSL